MNLYVFCITNWKEDQIFLKVLFPLALNSTEATYEIQYGNVKRLTSYNTSWDQARFEVCYHKWMDISEGGYGVSFLNDCKYGVSVEENTVGLSLIKSGMYPNPTADREHHQVIYSILPHIDSWKEAGVVKEAYLLNNPLQGYIPCESTEKKLPDYYGLVDSDSRNVMIETLKKAEDGEGVILRLYEYENTRSEVLLTFAKKVKRIWECDMMENCENLLSEGQKKCQLVVEPFEIKTLMVEFDEDVL